MKRLTPERLAEIKAKSLPVVTWDYVFKPTEGADPPSQADQDALNEYFKAFAQPQTNETGDSLCVGCGSVIQDGLMGVLLGGAPGSCTMQWDLAHGEMFCTECGWPARGYHYDIGEKGDPLIKRLGIVLQYHPEGISLNGSGG